MSAEGLDDAEGDLVSAIRGLRDLSDVAAAVPDGGKRPHKTLIHVPILLPGENTSTLVDPGKSLYGRIPELIDQYDVTDLSYWVGRLPLGRPAALKAAILGFGDEAEAVERAVIDGWPRKCGSSDTTSSSLPPRAASKNASIGPLLVGTALLDLRHRR